MFENQNPTNKKFVIVECLFYILLFILLLQLIGRFIPKTSTLSWQSLSAGAFMCASSFAMLSLNKKAVLFIKPSLKGFFSTGWYLLLTATVFFFLQLIFSDDLPSGKGFMMFAISSLLTAISEELLFRGVVSCRLEEEMGKKESTIMLSAAFFALAHLANLISVPAMIISSFVQVIYTFSLGMMLTYSYFKTKNLLVPIALHFLFNTLSSFSKAVNTAGSEIQDIGTAEVIILLAIMVPGIFCTHLMIKRAQKI